MAGAAVAVFVVLRHTGGPPVGVASAVPAAASGAIGATDPLSYPRQGLRLVRPVRWTADGAKGVIRLRSDSRRLGLVIVTAPHRVGLARLQHDTERAVVRSTPSLRLLLRRRAVLGGVSARQSVLLRDRRGRRRLEVLVLALSSRYRTYAVTVFNRTARPAARTPAVRTVLDSLQILRPTA